MSPLILAALIVITIVVYSQAFRLRFTSYDDDIYVTNNPNIQQGLTFKSIAWAFNVGYAANWHPLTWISHELDISLFGLDATGHHATSVLLHIANTLLLFWALAAATGAKWKSSFVAVLFGVHPLHVESVAWVAERKDVLSTLFWMLTMLAYFRYARQPRAQTYALVALCFALGLMAKPMLVTLPIVLVMLDYWPLGRTADLRFEISDFRLQSRPGGEDPKAGLRRLIEKVPLLGLSAGSGVLTVVAQHSAGAVASLQNCPLGLRAENAIAAYVRYIGKMFWPSGLAVHYPYPTSIPGWQVAAAGAFLMGMTALAIRLRHSRPYVLLGWLWYVVSLLPVIGIVQVGDQSIADRYTYVPLIGLFIIAAWGVPDLVDRITRTDLAVRAGRAMMIGAGFVVVLALGLAAHRQVSYWKDSETLFRRSLAVTKGNFIIHNNLGAALCAEGSYDEAMEQCEEALRINPSYPEAHYNLATCLQHKGDIAGAIRHYEEAIRLKPDYAKAHNDLAYVLLTLGRFDEVIAHCRDALRARPEYAAAHGNLAIAFFYQGRYDEALSEAQLCINHGGKLPPAFLRDLASKMRGSRPP